MNEKITLTFVSASDIASFIIFSVETMTISSVSSLLNKCSNAFTLSLNVFNCVNTKQFN